MEVSQIDGINLLTQYWYNYQESHHRVKYKYLFVGDVHGDLSQFILPLIDTGTITLNGQVTSVKQRYPELDIPVPEYTCNKCDSQIYYLGDLSDGYMFTRQVLIMMANVLRQCKNVHFCFGNHDMRYFGKLDVTKVDAWTFEEHFESLNLFVSSVSNLKLYHGKITGASDDFLFEYFRIILETYKELFKLGEVCFLVEDIICSHTILNEEGMKELEIDWEHLTAKDLVDSINKAFKAKDKSYIGKNKIGWNRIDADRVYPKQIVGHSVGGYYKPLKDDVSINPVPCSTYGERLLHCKPTNGIYYFDVGASACYSLDKISRPDYFYLDGSMHVSDADSLLLLWNKKTYLVTFKSKSNIKPDQIIPM